MAKTEIWIGTIEISWSDEKTPTVFQPAFTVVTTWAASAEEFREKCVRMLTSYGRKLLDVERANPVPESDDFSEEVENMLERTRDNPKAIIYGTFYSYPVMYPREYWEEHVRMKFLPYRFYMPMELLPHQTR